MNKFNSNNFNQNELNEIFFGLKILQKNPKNLCPILLIRRVEKVIKSFESLKPMQAPTVNSSWNAHQDTTWTLCGHKWKNRRQTGKICEFSKSLAQKSRKMK